MSAGSGGGTVRTAARVVAVLDLLAKHGPLRLSDVARQLELPKSSAHGLLHTLSLSGYLEHRDDGTYGLGLRLWQVAQSYDGIERLRRLLKPVMAQLVERTGETVQLAQLDGTDVLYLEIALSPHPMKLASAVGERLPAHAAGLGKALLAALDPDDARARLSDVELVALTPHTITDVNLLMRELETIRRRGCSFDNEEALLGLRCVAMGVRDTTGGVPAALSVSIPTPRYSRAVATDVRSALDDAVADASRRLGAA
ncbi:IclR family transcriptional regulator [Conexibacter woesei]|uniref:Glycerol operon regulatory protein n=1 Tax=Conexibacter woesei (strain DSM 14684 / CCUG 47730 / CIP 108061 / JCM 11494 / NBRC 100937 / ID131577) TaxID=469383 RepID=D3F3L2_CONWI|nr:IclR family transcriptional regulator [Conexibacter woesei]ADB52377.1 transcriptional regulator, IclR family [Conexibacter woesei DSM 14684]